MCNIVTERFIKCHNALKENGLIKSSRQFAMNIGCLPQGLNEILKGNREVSVELIRKAIEIYNINSDYLFMGNSPMFKGDVDTNLSACESTSYTVSQNKISYLPISAQAGYAEQFNDAVFEHQLLKFSLPDQKFNHGIHRCFDVAGDSMDPALQAGDKVVCSLVDRNRDYKNVKDNFVYVIVLQDSILIKRVVNNIAKNNTLDLLSDNNYYPPQTINAIAIVEMWLVEVRISNFHPGQQVSKKALLEEISEMKQTMNTQAKTLQNLNITMEKLLKANREKAFI